MGKEITIESLSQEVTALTQKVESLVSAIETITSLVDDQAKKLAVLETSSDTVSEDKKPAFKAEAAANISKDKSVEVHFEVEKKQYVFKQAFVHKADGTKVTAKVAQSDKELCEQLVKIGSAQIKEIL